MRDLKDRLRVLDQVHAPDMWHDASTRRPGEPAQPLAARTHARNRFYAAASALVVAVGAFAFVWRAFEGTDGVTTSVSPGPVSSSHTETREPSFGGWVVSAKVSPTESGLLKISIGDITRAPRTNSEGWLQHDFTLENEGRKTLVFADTRTSTFLGPPPRSLIAGDTGCGYAANSKTAPVKAGACLTYLDAITLKPGESVTRQISLWKELNGMPALTSGAYTFTKHLGYTVAGQDSERDVTVRVTYAIDEATDSGAVAPIPSTRVCEAPEGSQNDVAHEPDWRRWAAYVDWTTDDGCLVRIDVLAERPGSSHCGWEDVQVLITGDPVGSHYGRKSATVTYIRDPHGTFGDRALVDGFDPEAIVPTDAEYSGFRSGTRELWTAASDPDAAYIVDGGSTERWPEGAQLVCR